MLKMTAWEEANLIWSQWEREGVQIAEARTQAGRTGELFDHDPASGPLDPDRPSQPCH